jgi:hypothetical protein
MKPIVIAFMLLFAAEATIAQQVVASAGNTGITAGYTVDWTLGEPAIGTFMEGGYTFMVGFHQPSIAPDTDIPIIGDRNYINVYPNPARSFIYLQLHDNRTERIRQLSLIDMRGVTVMHIPGHELDSDPFQISLDGKPPGLYLMQMVFTDGTRQVVKVSVIL